MKNFFVRTILSYLLFFSAIFFPLVIFFPTLNERDRLWMSILVVILAVLAGLVLIYFNYRVMIKPLSKLNEASKKITGGQYDTRINIRHADGEVQKLSENLNSIAGEFENLEDMRRSFVSNASHELRSPLTSMQGFLQALLDGTITEPEEQDKYLKIVLSETRRLSQLVNSMLDLSRMESGNYPLNLSRFEINSVIRQIVERFQPTLVKREIVLDLDFAREATNVFADKDKIIQVLINLIDNAIKYSPSHSRVSVSTHIHNRKLYITVKDTGFGISKRDQLLIWDKFYMTDKARTPSKAKGTGLGLAIVKKIIDDHKEVIWVESSKETGATFIFTLSIFDPNKHREK